MNRDPQHVKDVHSAFDELVAQAWADPDLKQRLLESPRGEFEARGIPVPQDVRITILRNTPEEWFFVLPGEPKGEYDHQPVPGSARAISDCC